MSCTFAVPISECSSARATPNLPKEDKVVETFNALRYTGVMPASIEHEFTRKGKYPVYIPELNIFGKIHMKDKNYRGENIFYLMGECDAPDGTISKVSAEKWKSLISFRILFCGPYVKYLGTKEDTTIISMEEYEEASGELFNEFPLRDLQKSLENLPKNRFLAKNQVDNAILSAKTKLRTLGTVVHQQELYITKWVSEDYIPDEEEYPPYIPKEEGKEEEVVEEVEVKLNMYGKKKGILKLEPELLTQIQADLQVKEVREKRNINELIKDVVVRTPQPMIKPPFDIPEEEEIAWLSLDNNIRNRIFHDLGQSPIHAHLVLDSIFPKKFVFRMGEFNDALSTMGKMMFYCLKRLRFGDLCLEKSKDDALNTENITGELKKRWEPVTKEEREKLLACISRMILKTSHFYISEAKTIEFLNQFLPFWDIPGVNFTGSICCFLSLFKHAYNSTVARCYAPTRYEITYKDFDEKYSRYGCQPNIYPLYIYFPIEDDMPYFAKKMKAPTDPIVLKFISANQVLKPAGDINRPMACIVMGCGNVFKMMLVNILPNTDCDVPVFQHDELDDIALKIYNRVKRNGTILERQERGNGSHCWNISMVPRIPEEYASSPEGCTNYIRDFMNFYPVQVYRTREEHIWTHHVAMTRIYGKCVDGKPEFSASPDQLYSVINNISERYNYFAGKTTPLSILNKYQWRGFEAPHYIIKKFNLDMHYKNENLSIPIGMVTTKMKSWLKSSSEFLPEEEAVW